MARALVDTRGAGRAYSGVSVSAIAEREAPRVESRIRGSASLRRGRIALGARVAVPPLAESDLTLEVLAPRWELEPRMRSKRLVSILFVVVEGCSSHDHTSNDGSVTPDDSAGRAGASTNGVADPGTNRSGTRLRQILAQDPAGDAPTFAGIVDTKLSVRCDLLNDEAGDLRCLPTGNNSLSYADAACTIPIAFVGESCGIGSYVLASTEDSPCTPARNSFTVFQTSAVMAPDGPRYDLAGGNCVPVGGTTQGYFVASKVPKETFVGFSEDVVASGSSLSTRVVLGEDGSQFASAIVDATTSEECMYDARTPPNGSTICIPIEWAQDSGDLFDGSACDQPVVTVHADPSQCGKPGLVVKQDSCGVLIGFAKVGAAVPASSVFQETTSCSPIAPSQEPAWFFAKGEPVSPGDLPGVSFALAGAGRLRSLQTLSRAGAALLPPNRLYDTAQSLSCGLADFPDGTTRCLTSNVALGGPDYLYYADHQCTQLLARMPSQPPCSSANETMTAFALTDDSSCGPRVVVTAMYTLGAVVEGPVFVSSGGACIPSEDPTGIYRSASVTTEWDSIAAKVVVKME